MIMHSTPTADKGQHAETSALHSLAMKQPPSVPQSRAGAAEGLRRATACEDTLASHNVLMDAAPDCGNGTAAGSASALSRTAILAVRQHANPCARHKTPSEASWLEPARCVIWLPWLAVDRCQAAHGGQLACHCRCAPGQSGEDSESIL